MPNLYIITGSNGAGKSTTGAIYLPSHIADFFDGDKLYMQQRALLWQQGMRVDKEIKRIASEKVDNEFEEKISSALALHQDFAYEGHFSEDSSWQTPMRFKKAGYNIHLIFMGLSNIELSAERVLLRSKEGGHHVDIITLRNNFFGNMKKLEEYFRVPDHVEIIDCSESSHNVLAVIDHQIITETVPYNQLPEWFITYMPNIANLIRAYGQLQS